MYGGRIDNSFDQIVLDSFVDQLFGPSAYDVGFKVNDHIACSAVPEGTSMKTFIKWAEELPSSIQNPVMIGLSGDSDQILASQQEKLVSSRLFKLRALSEHHLSTIIDRDVTAEEKERVRIQHIMKHVKNIEMALVDLPNSPSLASTGPESSILESLNREYGKAQDLKTMIKGDMGMIRRVCEGVQKHSNASMLLFAAFKQNSIPAHWQRYFKFPRSYTLVDWYENLKNRLAHLRVLVASTNVDKLIVNLGLLFNPAAFITAAKQFIARRNKVTLENIKMSLKQDVGSGDLRIGGLFVQGADFKSDGSLVLGRSRLRPLHDYMITWEYLTANDE